MGQRKPLSQLAIPNMETSVVGPRRRDRCRTVSRLGLWPGSSLSIASERRAVTPGPDEKALQCESRTDEHPLHCRHIRHHMRCPAAACRPRLMPDGVSADA